MQWNLLSPSKSGRRRYYFVRYKLEAGSPWRSVSLRTRDKRVAEKKAADFVRKLEHEALGIGVPKLLSAAAASTLDELAVEWDTDAKARGRTADYRRKVRARIRDVSTACGWVRLRDASAPAFERWRASATVGPATKNHYLDALRTLWGWLERSGRVEVNPWTRLTKVETRGMTEQRRALSEEEQTRLVQAGGVRRGLVYALALRTGLRRRELATLQWSDVDLDSSTPKVTVRAANAKNRTVQPVPLAAELVPVLAELRAGASASARVFAKGMPSHHTFHADLKQAGIARETEAGKVDFHALRHTFITAVNQPGVSPAAAMKLARHSDPRLTMAVYSHPAHAEMQRAVDGLPQLMAGVTQGAHGHAHGMVLAGRVVSHAGGESRRTHRTQVPSRQAVGHDESSLVAACRDPYKQWSRGESNPRAR